MCPLVNKGKKQRRRSFSSSAVSRTQHLSSDSGVAKLQSWSFYVILSRLSSKALLEFKYRHVVGLVGLCNRILHTMVYRLLLFYIGNAMCIFNAQRGRESLHISSRVTENRSDRSLSMQSGSPSTSVLPSIFLVVLRLSYVLYIMYRHSYLANKLLYYY